MINLCYIMMPLSLFGVIYLIFSYLIFYLPELTVEHLHTLLLKETEFEPVS